MHGIRIISFEMKYVEALHDAVDVVARERRYLGLVEGPPLGATRAFVEMLVAGGGFELVAVDDADAVVGWSNAAAIGLYENSALSSKE